MLIIKSLFPRTIETRQSKFNGTITVQKFLGKYSLIAGNLTQSGNLVEHIWQKGILYLKKNNFKNNTPKHILIMGLGGGSLIKYLDNTWPNALITALEIDPVMIDLGRQYFNLDKYSNVTIINHDAFAWLAKNKQTFNLILIDLYQGRTLPSKATTTSFFQTLKAILPPSGAILFNRLVLTGQKAAAQKFKDKLTQVFHQVHRIPTQVNWLLLCS